ncbi:MAG: YitT family protein [Firmicutes bacterium]|nr:YitT family protein [Bacillota bacterium]
MKKLHPALQIVILTLATVTCSAGVYFFEIPAQIPIGSVSGLSLILSQLLPLTVGQINVAINCTLLILGYLLIGKEFGLKTVYTSLVLSISLLGFEKLFPNHVSIMNDRVLDIIVAIVIASLMQTILFQLNASSGGLDIVGKIIQKFFRVDLGKAISTAGLVIAATAVFAYDLKTAILALVFTYFNGIVLDNFIFGMNEKKKVCVISAQYKEISRFILDNLDAGATIYTAEGAYNNSTVKELVTILDKSKYNKLLNYLQKKDPHAFITVYPVHEVYTEHIVGNRTTRPEE